MIATPEEVMKREWSPITNLAVFDITPSTELFVWAMQPDDPTRRTLACVQIGAELFVVVRDYAEKVTQAWVVL